MEPMRNQKMRMGIYDELVFGMVCRTTGSIWEFPIAENVLEKYIGHYNEMFGTNFSTKDSQTFTTIIMTLPKESAVKKLT